MLNNLRRFAPTIAALGLILAPMVGCGTDTPPTPVVEVPYNPPTAVDAPAPALDKLEHEVDRNVQTTSGDVKHEADKLKRAAEQTENDAKHDLKATEENLKKSAEKAFDNVLGDPK